MPRLDYFADVPVTQGHYWAGGVYAKHHVLPAGHSVEQHSHEHAHMSILAQGSVRLTVDGVHRVVDAPACLDVPAHAQHTILALADCHWFCIWREDIATINEADIDG